jgi:high-affinity nickel permease
MDNFATFGMLTLGLALGLRHALEADHIAAVSTIVTERRHKFAGVMVGALWGLGHTFSLLVAGILVVVLHFEISERAAQVLEFGVALMLIFLGLRALRKLLRRSQVHMHLHKHGELVHSHAHLHEVGAQHSTVKSAPEHSHIAGLRPFLIGAVHGMAGSGALMLIILAAIPSPYFALLYIVVFGLGSIVGMMLMSLLMGSAFQFASGRFAAAETLLSGTAGVVSFLIGGFMAYQIAFVEGVLF